MAGQIYLFDWLTFFQLIYLRQCLCELLHNALTPVFIKGS